MADTKAKITIGAFLGRFGSAGIAYLATTIDFFALTLALPSMAAELGTTTTSLQWTASGYMIATGVSMIPGSRIADLVGRRRVLLFGVAIFGLASLWVGLSTTVESVIAARIVQGLGAGLIFPAMMSVISNSTTPAERPKVLGMIGALAGLGTALGPVLGGGLSSTVGWRWVFFFNVPLAAVAFVWGHFQLKDSKDPALSGKRIRNLDFVGTFLIAAGVVGISLGIDNAGAGALAALAPPSELWRCRAVRVGVSILLAADHQTCA
jgi:MFS family permease